MAELKMPELNTVHIAGNLTKDPVIRQTRNGTPVANFSIASVRWANRAVPFRPISPAPPSPSRSRRRRT